MATPHESDYITDLFCKDRFIQQVAENCSKSHLPNLSITAEEGRFLQVLVRAIDARKVLEIGTFGGYSAAWMGRGMARDGRLTTVEIDPARADLARENLFLAGFNYVVLTANAHAIHDQLIAGGLYDFVFIDAEKEGYEDYFKLALDLTRRGGIIAAHNAFMYHTVAGDNPSERRTPLMREFNRCAAHETEFMPTIFPAGDGILFGVRL